LEVRLDYILTEKVVHYGGSFTSPMVVNHPDSGEEPFASPNP